MEIYLDNAATTKPVTQNAVLRHLDSAWYNPSAAYAPAESVFSAMKQTRQKLSKALGLHGGCIFTSGGTEANNMVIQSCYKPGAHYITSSIEHPSVYEVFRKLEQSGARVDYVKPRGFCIRAEDVGALVGADTVLISIMNVNNETGALNDIVSIGRAAKQINEKVLIHSDGVQALLKTPIDLSAGMVDYYTVSAHKIHALKGTGALIMRRGAAVKPLIQGGGQEHALRAGTENTLGIQAMDEALETGLKEAAAAREHIGRLRNVFVSGVAGIDGAAVNIPDAFVPHIVNVSFKGIRGEVLVRALGEKGICIGTGAACSRGKLSRTLLECGLSRAMAEGAVRISFCATNTAEEATVCVEEIEKAVIQLRRFHRI